MIRMKSITLKRYEGTREECAGPPCVAYTWLGASMVLKDWSRTAPEPGMGYHKCTFSVLFEDGKAFAGRYDLYRGQEVDLLDHFEGHLLHCAGRRKPAHYSEGYYKTVLARDPQGQRECQHILDTYQIGD